MPKVACRGSSLRIHLTTELFTHRRELSGRWVGGGGGGLLEGIRRQTDKVHIAWEQSQRTLLELLGKVLTLLVGKEEPHVGRHSGHSSDAIKECRCGHSSDAIKVRREKKTKPFPGNGTTSHNRTQRHLHGTELFSTHQDSIHNAWHSVKDYCAGEEAREGDL